MRADGISPDELVADIQPPKAEAKRQPRPAKYRYTDHTGAEKTRPDRKNAEADCRGCRPGKSLDSFLI